MSARESRSLPGLLGRLACVAVAAAVGVTGCGVGSGESGDTVNKGTRRVQQFRELVQRPDIDQAAQRYGEMVASLRSRLESELGIGHWRENPKTGGAAGCHEFPDVEGSDKESRTLRHWISDGNIPDDKWPRVVEITQEIARQYGFETQPRVIVDRPGNHQITAADAYGADLILVTKVNTVLQARTGCHPTAEARQRGTPRIPKYGQ